MDSQRTQIGSGGRLRLAALLGSLLIHLGLAAILLHVTKPVILRRPRPAPSTEIEVQEVELAKAKAPEPVPSTKKPHAPTATTRKTRVGGARLQAAPSPPAKLEAPKWSTATGQAYAGDVPVAPDLSAHLQFETASPGGETVHNRPGEVEPEGVRKSVAQARINQWIDDDTAEKRVDKGLVDDWFGRLDQSLDHALNGAAVPADLPSAVGGALTSRGGLKNYGAAAARYGATGTPSQSGASPGPTALPTAPDFGPVAQSIPGGTFQVQVDGSSRDPWTVVELRFDLSGKLRDSRVLESSGNRLFDGHVLHVLGLGLPGLPAAPDAGFGIHPEGTRSVWRVDGHMTYDHTKLSPNDIWYLPVATVINMYSGANLDDLVGQVTGRPQLHCKVQLLQVY